MLGAIIGDIAGSRFEREGVTSYDFDLFVRRKSVFTDDTVMTLAVAKALLDCKGIYSDLSEKAIDAMKELGKRHPFCGFGGMFYRWVTSDDRRPYNSFGNGSAMRVSPVAYAAKSLEEVKELSYKVTAVTHDHKEGIKGAEAIAVATFLALHGAPMSEIKAKMQEYYPLEKSYAEIAKNYSFDVTCQGSVPPSLQAFFESDSFEDAIRKAVCLNGDTDTMGAMTGAVAGAYYGVPKNLAKEAAAYLTPDLMSILQEFENVFVKSNR